MKKIFSIAMMAMMALCAAVTTVSCTNKDDDAQAFNTEVKLTATVTSDAYSCNCENVMLIALKKFYEGKIGSTGTVSYVKMDGGDVINFTTTKANLEALKQALKNISSEETDAVLNNYSLTWASISLLDNVNPIISYYYNAPKKEEPKTETKTEEKKAETKYYTIENATWTSTILNTTYTLVLTSEKVSDHEYKAYFHVGDKVYPGKAANANNTSIVFLSDEDENGTHLCNLVLTGDATQTTMKGALLYSFLPVCGGEFTRK